MGRKLAFLIQNYSDFFVDGNNTADSATLDSDYEVFFCPSLLMT